MGILAPLEKDIGYLKTGLMGDMGTGKSTTAALMAIGLHRHINSKKPVGFFDSERGSGFLTELFKIAKIEIVGVRSMSFADLSKFMRESEKELDIIIIDSITHPWREWVDAVAESQGGYLSVSDWGPIKRKWSQDYTMRFVNSKLHIIMCGREKNVWEDTSEGIDPKTGKKRWKPVIVGTKMAVENEAGYEPNLMIELERQMLNDGATYARVAKVIKDRSFRLDGQRCEFVMPLNKAGKPDLQRLVEENMPFKFIYPHIESLDPAAGAASPGVSEKTSAELVNRADGTWIEEEKERDLLLGNVEAILTKYFPGQEKLSKKAKADIIEGATWAMNQRMRNWQFIESKFKLDQVKAFFMYVDLITKPENQTELNAALAVGVAPDGKIENADGAAAAVKDLCLKLLGATSAAPSELPF